MDKYHKRLKELREQSGYSQEALAFDMGIGRSTYGKFERGETRLFSHNLEKFFHATGFTLDDLTDAGSKPVHGILSEGLLSDRIDELSEAVKAQQELIESLLVAVEKLRGSLTKND